MDEALGSGTTHAPCRAQLLAPAKLTLSLRVGGTLPDGRHSISAEMVTVSLCDTLVISEGDGLEVTGEDGVSWGFEVPLGPSNLACAALAAVGKRAHIAIHKRIPSGAGLGGASADAAAVLRWAGLAALGPGSQAALATALALGSDVPFCLLGGRALVSGAGEVLEPLPYLHRRFALVTPPIGVSTAAVYAQWDRMGGPRSLGNNDLEAAALEVEPRLAPWRDALAHYTGGAPELAGSGSTWFVDLSGRAVPAECDLAVGGQSARVRVVTTCPRDAASELP